jgi:hypothetical protein
MQQLGLSPIAPKTTPRIRDVFWPDFSDPMAAETAANYGMYSAYVVAVFSFIVGWTSIPIAGVVNAVIFVILGFFINRMSRAAATIAFSLHLLEVVSGLVVGVGGAVGVAIGVQIMLIAPFLNAARATWHYSRQRAQRF